MDATMSAATYSLILNTRKTDRYNIKLEINTNKPETD